VYLAFTTQSKVVVDIFLNAFYFKRIGDQI